MIQKKLLRLDGCFAAAPMMMFLTQKADGTPDFTQTNGVLTVMSNSKRINDDGTTTEYVDKFDINVKGSNLLSTVANQVSTGKGIDSLVAMVRTKKKGAIKTDENDNPKKTGNGTWDYVDLPVFHLREIELGNDSEKMVKAQLEAKIEAEKAQGTLPAIAPTDKLVDIFLGVRKAKNKNQDFDIAEVTRRGLWGHATVWDKVRGTWKPNGESKATTSSSQVPVNNILSKLDLNRLDPETLAKVLKAMGEPPKDAAEAAQEKFTNANDDLDNIAF